MAVLSTAQRMSPAGDLRPIEHSETSAPVSLAAFHMWYRTSRLLHVWGGGAPRFDCVPADQAGTLPRSMTCCITLNPVSTLCPCK